MAKDQLVCSLTREVLRARGLFNIRGVLEHVARIIEQETHEQSNTTRTLRNVYDWRKLSSSARKIVEKIQERYWHRSFKIEKIGDQLAGIYGDASTEVHHFQVHDKIDVSSLNDKDAKIMKSVCCAMSIEILTD